MKFSLRGQFEPVAAQAPSPGHKFLPAYLPDHSVRFAARPVALRSGEHRAVARRKVWGSRLRITDEDLKILDEFGKTTYRKAHTTTYR